MKLDRVGFELSHGKASEHVALSIGTSPPAAGRSRGRSPEPSKRVETAATVNPQTLHRPGSVSMGTEYILTDDDKPAAEPSLAEDVIELRLLTAGDPTGPANIGWAQEHHNL
jgi:hypothetical protein